MTAQLASRTQGRVVGVDRSGSMVRLAAREYPPSTHANLAFCWMDAARLGFSGGFNLIFSNATLHWVPDHPAVLAGVRRALRPGGRLIFSMGGAGNASEIIAALDRLISRHPWKTYFNEFAFPYSFYSPGDYRRWLPEAGLTPERVELVEKDMLQAGPEGLAGWIRTTWLPYLARVPEAQHESFTAAVVNAYLEQYPPDAQGNVHVKMVRLEVEARG